MLSYKAFKFLLRCRIQNILILHHQRLSYCTKIELSLFGIWATVLYKSNIILRGLLWRSVRSILLLGILLAIPLCSLSICPAELKGPSALGSYVSFCIKFFAIYLTMWTAQWQNTCGTNAHHKVHWRNRVGSFWNDYVQGQWKSLGYTTEARKSSSYNRKFPKEIHSQCLGYIYINWIVRQNAPKWQLRTFWLGNFTKTPAIASSC